MLKHEGAENFNWNYVDQHILGYQDFAELPEVGNVLPNAIVKENLLFAFTVFTVSKISLSLLATANRANVGR